MANLTLTLETITPLFLSGAEPRGAPELREPSVRGALRYWLRAALGAVFGDRDLKGVKDAESQVFGSTKRASNVVVTLSHPELNVMPFQKERTQQSGGRHPKPSGRDYLFWSMAGFSTQPAKQAISKTSFTLTLGPRAGVSDENILFQAQAALWLWIHLGGLGSRARRTAGSLRVAAPVTAAELNFQTPETPGDLAVLLGQGLGGIRRRLAEIHNRSIPALVPFTSFDVLHPKTSSIWVLTGSRPWTTAEQAVEGIGAGMRDFRSYRPPDHDNVRDWLDKGKRPPTVERAAFGLPLPFRYSDGGPADVLQGRDHDRRSSPLSLRVSQLASGQFVGVAVLFESALLPRGEVLQFQRSRRDTALPKDYALIRQFIADKFTALEVSDYE